MVKRILLKWLIFSGLVMLQNDQCQHIGTKIIYDPELCDLTAAGISI